MARQHRGRRRGSPVIPSAGLEDLITSGARVAVSDGVGTPRSVFTELSAAARRVGGVRLVLGWMPASDENLDLSAFADVRALMGGWGLRRAIDTGQAHYLPAALGAAPPSCGARSGPTS